MATLASSPSEEAALGALQGSTDREAPLVGFDHRGTSDPVADDLPEDATLDDLVDFDTRALGWEEIRERSRTQLFGEPAARVQVTNASGHPVIVIQGFAHDQIYVLTFGAPTETDLEQSLPTFEAMIESLTPVSSQ